MGSKTLAPLISGPSVYAHTKHISNLILIDLYTFSYERFETELLQKCLQNTTHICTRCCLKLLSQTTK